MLCTLGQPKSSYFNWPSAPVNIVLKLNPCYDHARPRYEEDHANFTFFSPITRILDLAEQPLFGIIVLAPLGLSSALAAILGPHINMVKPSYQTSSGHKLSGNVA